MTGTAAQQPEHALAGRRFPNRRSDGFQNAGTTVSISPDWRYPATGIFNLFENTTMVAALIDRLTFRSHVLDMNGDSYRLKATMQNKA